MIYTFSPTLLFAAVMFHTDNTSHYNKTQGCDHLLFPNRSVNNLSVQFAQVTTTAEVSTTVTLYRAARRASDFHAMLQSCLHPLKPSAVQL